MISSSTYNTIEPLKKVLMKSGEDLEPNILPSFCLIISDHKIDGIPIENAYPIVVRIMNRIVITNGFTT